VGGGVSRVCVPSLVQSLAGAGVCMRVTSSLPRRQREGGSNSECKRRSRSATRTARQHLKMAEVAAKTQVAVAPEAPAPTTPATPSCPRLVEATLAETQEAQDMAALAAVARATTVPATPPPRSPMVTACSSAPLSGKRGLGPPSWASAGSSGGRSFSSWMQAAKKAREGQWIDIDPREYRSAIFDPYGFEWPYPNAGGPVIPRYRRGGSMGPSVGPHCGTGPMDQSPPVPKKARERGESL